MDEITSSLGILSSMITPAVLILAGGSLIATTSQRLGRVIDRVRKISQEFTQIESHEKEDHQAANKRRILYKLLHKSALRCRLLTRAMTILYVSLGFFVATSLSIGIVSITHISLVWIPTALGLTGASLLFVSSAILIIESRLTLRTIADEIDYVIETTLPHAPDDLKRNQGWQKWLGF
ncbi:MAG TPA: DUF2721 domain-containing protein [Chryseosolibacter sp.]